MHVKCLYIGGRTVSLNMGCGKKHNEVKNNIITLGSTEHKLVKINANGANMV